VGATGTINDAIFQQLNQDTSAGTGVFNSFVRIQATGIEQGYNTDGTVEFETKAGTWTHSLMLSAVPTLQLGSTVYREFCLDINQNGQSYLAYLYSKMGVNMSSDDGFEEWGVGVGGPIIPEPATIVLFGFGGLALIRKRRA